MKTGSMAALAALAVACLLPFAGDARPRPEPVAATPDYDALPPVNLSSSLVQQAAAYRAYVNRAAAINAGFTSPETVATAMQTASAYEPRQFLRGALAYAAIAALQDRTFVEAVRARGATLAARRALEYSLLSDPATVMQLPGAAGAANLAVAALHGEGLRIYSNGRLVKQAAYDTQRQAWANTRSPPQVAAAQLASVRVLGNTPLTADMVEADRLNRSITGGGLGVTPEDVQAPYSPLVARAVTLAALSAIGMAGDEQVSRIMPNLTDPEATFCLNMARLNLFQCLAVAGPHYEDMFCLGQHVLMDTGSCLIRGSGAAMPLDVRPPALPVPPARPAASGRRGR
jgi:hypothetical protein